MRIALLLGALGVTPVASAISSNETTSISPSSEFKPIPISDVRCFDDYDVPHDAYIGAKETMLKWPGPYSKNLTVSFPENSFEGAILVVCNFKVFPDHIHRFELDQVENILLEECGKGKGGAVGSRKWRKTYVVASKPWHWYQKLYKKKICQCPKHTLFCLPY